MGPSTSFRPRRRSSSPCVPPLFRAPQRPVGHSQRHRFSTLGVFMEAHHVQRQRRSDVGHDPSEHKGSPQGKLADAEVIFGAASGPLNGLRLIGFACVGTSRRREKRDVSGSAVLRERRTPQLRAAPSHQRGRQRAGRDSAVHPRRVQPRRDRLLNGPSCFPRRPGPSPRRLGPRVRRHAPSEFGRDHGYGRASHYAPLARLVAGRPERAELDRRPRSTTCLNPAARHRCSPAATARASSD